MRAPKPALIAEAALRLVNEVALSGGLTKLRDELSALGGTERIVREVEKLLDVRPEKDWSRPLEPGDCAIRDLLAPFGGIDTSWSFE